MTIATTSADAWAYGASHSIADCENEIHRLADLSENDDNADRVTRRLTWAEEVTWAAECANNRLPIPELHDAMYRIDDRLNELEN